MWRIPKRGIQYGGYLPKNVTYCQYWKWSYCNHSEVDICLISTMFIVFHIHFSKFYKLLASCLTYRYNIVMIFSVDFTRGVKLTYWNSLSIQFIFLSFSRVSLHATWAATTRHSVTRKITHMWSRWGTSQDFCLAFIDELEKTTLY